MIKNFFLIVCLSSPILTYSWETSKVSTEIDSAIQDLYNFKFDSFYEKINKIKVNEPENPLIPFLFLAGDWQYIQTVSGYSSSYNSINNNLKDIEPLYLDLISKYPNNPEYYLYLGSSYGMLSRISLAMGDYKSVLLNGYYALKYIKQSYSIDEKLYDVYMPIGLMEYFSCKSNIYIKGISALVGINSDCSEALKNLEIARKKSKYSWIETSNILAHAYLYFENNYENASDVIINLREKFPQNPYYLFIEAELFARTNKWDKIHKIKPLLIKETEIGGKYKKKECLIKYNYILALEDFISGNYIKSIDRCTWIINNYSLEFGWFKGFSYLLRGKSYDLIGQRIKAINDYKLSMKYTEYFPEYAEAQYLIKSKSISE